MSSRCFPRRLSIVHSTKAEVRSRPTNPSSSRNFSTAALILAGPKSSTRLHWYTTYCSPSSSRAYRSMPACASPCSPYRRQPSTAASRWARHRHSRSKSCQLSSWYGSSCRRVWTGGFMARPTGWESQVGRGARAWGAAGRVTSFTIAAGQTPGGGLRPSPAHPERPRSPSQCVAWRAAPGSASATFVLRDTHEQVEVGFVTLIHALHLALERA